MCCNLQTHTKVIASICLVLTGLGALNLIGTFGAFSSGYNTIDVDLIYGGNVAVAITVQILIFTSWIASDVCCLVGAIKNNKCLLIPFMIKMSLTILLFFGGIIMCLYYALLTGAVITELSSGVIAGQREGIVLQPYSSQPMQPNTGVATVYVPPGSQVYQQPPAYNPGMKQPV